MFKAHEEERETVREFCEKTKSGEEPNIDPEQIRLAFFHVYYCMNIECGELWHELKTSETHPLIVEWLNKWVGEDGVANPIPRDLM